MNIYVTHSFGESLNQTFPTFQDKRPRYDLHTAMIQARAVY